MTDESEVQRIRRAMLDDPELAWAWHCVVACSAMDEGMDHAAANRAAARFMYTAFGADLADYDQRVAQPAAGDLAGYDEEDFA